MRLPRRTSAAVSPTAHYTGYAWARHGLSAPGFETLEGRLMYGALSPLRLLAPRFVGTDLDDVLLARHRTIDHLLTQEIEAGRVTQVIEVAAGLSPRGWRFAHEYGDRLTYVEADLPGMAARKRQVLAKASPSSDRHRVVDFDALATAGPLSLAAISETMDRSQGLAVITEGLLMYFGREQVEGLWQRFADVLQGFADGVYLSDLHLLSENDNHLLTAGRRLLGVFVRGSVNFSFADETDALGALHQAGFGTAALRRPVELAGVVADVDRPGSSMVRVIEARPRAAS